MNLSVNGIYKIVFEVDRIMKKHKIKKFRKPLLCIEIFVAPSYTLSSMSHIYGSISSRNKHTYLLVALHIYPYNPILSSYIIRPRASLLAIKWLVYFYLCTDFTIIAYNLLQGCVSIGCIVFFII